MERTRFSDSSYTLNRMEAFSVDMNKQVEDTFVDDDSCDVNDDMKYDENCWPKEDPSGFRFKGKKKMFVKAAERIKLMLKKGNSKVIESITFKGLDSKNMNHGYKYIVEIRKEKDDD